MTLLELLGTNIAVRKTIWSKRGDKVTRRVVNHDAEFDIEPRTQIKIKDKANATRS